MLTVTAEISECGRFLQARVVFSPLLTKAKGLLLLLFVWIAECVNTRCVGLLHIVFFVLFERRVILNYFYIMKYLLDYSV